MTTIHTISRGVTWNVIATVAVKLISFGTLLIILRNLTVYQYGQVELTLASITTAALLTLPALASVAVADIGVEVGNKNFARAQGLYISFISLQILLGVLVTALVAFLAHSFGISVFGSAPTSLFVVATLLIFSGVTRNAVTSLMQIHLAFRAQSAFSILEEAFKLIVVAACIFLFNLGPLSVILSIICSQLLTQVCFLPYALYLYNRWGAAREIVSPFIFLSAHARWSVLVGYAGTFSQTMRPWIVKFFFGTEAVGLFAVAWGLVSQIIALMPLSDVLTPILPQALADSTRFRLILEKGMRYQFIAYVAGGLAALVAFPVIVHFFFAKYGPALPLFRVLLIYMIPAGFDLFTPTFLALKAQKNMFFAMLAKILFTALFMPLGALLGGIYGLCIGFVLAQTLYTFERYRQMRKRVPDFRIVLREFVSFDAYDRVILNLFWQKFRGVLSIFT